MGTHYARAETDRCGERKKDPVRCKLYDARGQEKTRQDKTFIIKISPVQFLGTQLAEKR